MMIKYYFIRQFLIFHYFSCIFFLYTQKIIQEKKTYFIYVTCYIYVILHVYKFFFLEFYIYFILDLI